MAVTSGAARMGPQSTYLWYCNQSSDIPLRAPGTAVTPPCLRMQRRNRIRDSVGHSSCDEGDDDTQHTYYQHTYMARYQCQNWVHSSCNGIHTVNNSMRSPSIFMRSLSNSMRSLYNSMRSLNNSMRSLSISMRSLSNSMRSLNNSMRSLKNSIYEVAMIR